MSKLFSKYQKCDICSMTFILPSATLQVLNKDILTIYYCPYCNATNSHSIMKNEYLNEIKR